jgi:hypothetical protein
MEKIWLTEIKAICPETGVLKTYAGQNIKAISKNLAKQYCQLNGLGYLKIIGELVAEIDYKTGEKIDYENTRLN